MVRVPLADVEVSAGTCASWTGSTARTSGVVASAAATSPGRPCGVSCTCQSTGTRAAAREVSPARLSVMNAPSAAMKATVTAMLTAAPNSSSGRRRHSPASHTVALT